jgi:hypothetical protein
MDLGDRREDQSDRTPLSLIAGTSTTAHDQRGQFAFDGAVMFLVDKHAALSVKLWECSEKWLRSKRALNPEKGAKARRRRWTEERGWELRVQRSKKQAVRESPEV